MQKNGHHISQNAGSTNLGQVRKVQPARTEQKCDGRRKGASMGEATLERGGHTLSGIESKGEFTQISASKGTAYQPAIAGRRQAGSKKRKKNVGGTMRTKGAAGEGKGRGSKKTDQGDLIEVTVIIHLIGRLVVGECQVAFWEQGAR